MAKVEVHDAPAAVAPSQEIVRAANKSASTKDARGRTIKFRRMMPSLRQRLRAIAGPELSKNEGWIGEAVFAFAVTDIDGDPVLVNSIRELEIVMDRLDDDGLEAVALAYVEAFGAAENTVDTVKN